MAELMRALEAVRQGTASLDPAVTHRVMAMLRQKNAQRNPFKDLTERELRVLFLVAQGKTNTVIAEELVLSEKTVRNYVSLVITKLGFTNRVEAATFAMQNRIEDFLPETDLEDND
ncbi:MAG: response regulator transcription factor [Chloroflexi bacterium]|nr:response regulator transcription factor [Chloroflexota bacterium]